MNAPSMHPHELLTAVRICLPDNGNADESGLRALLPELDAHIAEYEAATGQCLAEVDPA